MNSAIAIQAFVNVSARRAQPLVNRIASRVQGKVLVAPARFKREWSELNTPANRKNLLKAFSYTLAAIYLAGLYTFQAGQQFQDFILTVFTPDPELFIWEEEIDPWDEPTPTPAPTPAPTPVIVPALPVITQATFNRYQTLPLRELRKELTGMVPGAARKNTNQLLSAVALHI